jgi:hypothetical protein
MEFPCRQRMFDDFRVVCARELLVVLYCVFGGGVCLSEGVPRGKGAYRVLFLTSFFELLDGGRDRRLVVWEDFEWLCFFVLALHSLVP